MAISVRTATLSEAQAATAPRRAAHARAPKWSFGRKVSSKDLLQFYSQLALMLEVNVPMSRALRALAAQTAHEHLRAVLVNIREDMEGGRQLSASMARHPRVFDGITVSMVQAGETGGFLQKTLMRIVDMQERRQAMLAQLRAALTYPAILCVMSIGVVIFIMVGVLPKFLVFFAGKEALLPITTRFLLATSESMKSAWWAYLVGGVGLVVGLKLLLESPPGKRFRDTAALVIPLIKKTSRKMYMVQFFRTVGHLLESNVPLVPALGVARTTVGNYHYQNGIQRLVDAVEQGGAFTQAFQRFPAIDPSIKAMIASGEEAGHIDKVMLRIAEHAEREIERELKVLSSLIEPLTLILLGSGVGVIVASVVLPLFKLAHAIH